MILPVGHLFTDSLIIDLKKKGFAIHGPVQSNESYISYYCPLLSPEQQLTGFEVRQILDESVYAKNTKIENFEPFEQASVVQLPQLSHKNTAQYFIQSLHQTDLEHSDIKHYFKIRKYPSLWALHIQCTDLNQFIQLAHPDIQFKYNDADAALIHLNPSCFDLLITQKS